MCIRDRDGRVPDDNPFAGREGAHPAIWSYGNRNIQGMVLDGERGVLWAVEHGPRGGDELNIIRKGANYGWPVVTRGINYSGTPITDKTEAPGIERPVIDWTPSIAVGGLALYNGSAFPGWRGNLFATALAGQKLVRIVLRDNESTPRQEALLERSGRIRDVRVFRDGFLYVLYDEPGKIVRLVPAA
ncbi:MAG: PQQ-dependent sugar dehydrogenase, partial [Terrimicrobiaceae bacterium]|nr:PQQ-dependent sugar dehydrogenase [Terrimicrobiaceae bacterium]